MGLVALSFFGWIGAGAGFAQVPLEDLEARFVRGDSDADGTINLTDAIHTLGYLYKGAPAELGCHDAADANDDGNLDIADPIYVLGFFFRGTMPFPPPFPACGIDTTDDELPCDSFAPCPFPSVVQSGRILSVLALEGDRELFADLSTPTRDMLESRGIEIDDVNHQMRSPEMGLAGFWVEVEGVRSMLDTDGVFLVNTFPGTEALHAVPVFQEEEDEVPVGTISTIELTEPGGAPPPALLRISAPFPVEEMNPPDLEGGQGGDCTSLRSNLAYCAPGVNTNACCLDYNNPLGDGAAYQRNASSECGVRATFNYAGSTCFVWTVLKPYRPCLFEAAFFPGLLPPCWLKHKYRNCQNMDENDLSLSPESGKVGFGGTVTLTVRNNTAANTTHLSLRGARGASLRLRSPGGATLRRIRPGEYILQNYSDAQKKHFESVVMDFVAPTNKSGCSLDYTVVAYAAGITAKSDILVTEGKNCWKGKVTFSEKVDDQQQAACEGGSGSSHFEYTYSGTIRVVDVLAFAVNDDFAVITLKGTSKAEASWSRNDQATCQLETSSGCKYIKTETLQETASGSATGTPAITILANPDGTYFLGTEMPVVEIRGRFTDTTSLEILTSGCEGEGRTVTGSVNQTGAFLKGNLQGQLGTPGKFTRISGNLDEEGDFIGHPSKIHVEWDLSQQ